MEKLKKLAKQFNDLKSDTGRYKFILDHKDVFMLMLDNDQTFPTFQENAVSHLTVSELENLPELNDFDDYLGWSGGIFDLLKVIGIKANGV